MFVPATAAVVVAAVVAVTTVVVVLAAAAFVVIVLAVVVTVLLPLLLAFDLLMWYLTSDLNKKYIHVSCKCLECVIGWIINFMGGSRNCLRVTRTE